MKKITNKNKTAVLHIADLHAGGFRNVYSYLDRLRTCFRVLVKTIVALDAEHIIIVFAGDLYDGIPKESERKIVERALFKLLKDKRVQIVMVNGNHDYYDHQGVTLLSSFEEMCNEKIVKNLHVVVNNPGVVTLKAGVDTYRFLCVPCQQNLTTKELRKILKSLASSSEGEYSYTYAVVHEAMNGSISESNHKLPSKVEVPDLEYIDGYLLGDIHRRQQMGKNAWYCGSPWQTKYDEELTKGILRWHRSEVEFIELEGIPKLYEVKTEKLVRKYANTKHSVRYTGLEKIDIDAPNVFHVPKAVKTFEHSEDSDVAVKVSKIRALSKRDMVRGLRGFLQGDAKLPEEDAEHGVKYVKRELGLAEEGEK